MSGALAVIVTVIVLIFVSALVVLLVNPRGRGDAD